MPNSTSVENATAYDYSIHYQVWHDESNEHAAQMSAMHQAQLRPLLPESRSGSVLDIGCGMGFALLAMRDLGFQQLTGIDLDPSQVTKCRRRGLAVEHVSDTASFLESCPEEFDVVLMLEVLEHIPVVDQIKLMRAVYRSIRPGGRVIITTPNANSIIASRLRYMDYTHCCSFTEHSLRFILKSAEFDTVRLTDPPQRRRPPLRLWQRSTRLEFRKWLVRYLWRQVLAAEDLDPDRVSRIPISTHLQAVGIKSIRVIPTT